MRRFSFSYQTIVRFDAFVARHYFLLRCLPVNNPCQQVAGEQLHLISPAKVCYGTDALGNRIQYGCVPGRHDLFVFAASGLVELKAYRLPEPSPSGMYKIASRMTETDAEMEHHARRWCCQGTPLEQALSLADGLHGYLTYAPGSTGVGTPAIEAFHGRRGVCQDYAHVLLALCRSRGLAARYVAGFLPGEGATHAWVEVHSEGAWYAIDPTNNNRIDCGYIKVAQGRDAADCPVNRGLFTGVATQTTEVRVVTEELQP